eukprot:scaffold7364_cov31-Tisochrysis_lutea.AAC.2
MAYGCCWHNFGTYRIGPMEFSDRQRASAFFGALLARHTPNLLVCNCEEDMCRSSSSLVSAAISSLIRLELSRASAAMSQSVGMAHKRLKCCARLDKLAALILRAVAA